MDNNENEYLNYKVKDEVSTISGRALSIGMPVESIRSMLSTRLCTDFKSKFNPETLLCIDEILAACCIINGKGASSNSLSSSLVRRSIERTSSSWLRAAPSALESSSIITDPSVAEIALARASQLSEPPQLEPTASEDSGTGVASAFPVSSLAQLEAGTGVASAFPVSSLAQIAATGRVEAPSTGG